MCLFFVHLSGNDGPSGTLSRIDVLFQISQNIFHLSGSLVQFGLTVAEKISGPFDQSGEIIHIRFAFFYPVKDLFKFRQRFCIGKLMF